MKTPTSRQLVLALLGLGALVSTGCVQQSMANQPKFKPLQPTTLFPDGRSSRTPEAGTVSRTWRDDPHLLTGKLYEAPPQEEPKEAPAPLPPKENGEKFVKSFATTFPMPVTEAMVRRGQNRFNIFCTACHGYAGSGDGVVVLRGFTRPPSLVQDAHDPKDNISRGIAYQGVAVLLPDAPVGYYFHVISNGFGAMPEHATQIPVEDRWAIAAYLKALQRSQHYEVAKMRDDEQAAIKKAIEAAKKKGAAKEGGAH